MKRTTIRSSRFWFSIFAGIVILIGYSKVDALGFDDPYVGVEVIQTNQNYKTGYGKDIFYKNTININMFAGALLSKYVGVEVGYEVQPTHSNVVVLGPGDALPGNIVLGAGQTVTVQSTIKMKNPYVGVFGEYSTNFKNIGIMKFQGLFGFSVSKIEAWQATPAQNGVNLDQTQYNASIRTYDKTQTVPMVKLTASHDLTKHIGLRFSINYRNLNGFSVNAPQGNGISEIKLRDTIGVGLGVMYTF